MSQKPKQLDQRVARLAPEARRREIVAKAIAYFADVGFDGSTRELARRIGVTQPLLYRYFPTKDDLIQEVYDTVYVRKWNPAWIVGLADRSEPLRDRLIAFYRDYTDTIFERSWMRIYFISSLKGFDITKWYLKSVKEQILTVICCEFRRDLGLDPDAPLGEEELELAWTMHGSIFYGGIREHIYQLDLGVDRETLITSALEMYLVGAAERVRRLNAPGVRAKQAQEISKPAA